MNISADKAYVFAQSLSKLLIHFKPHKFMTEIKPTEMMVIMCLYHNRNNDMTPSDICDELGLSKSALTAILNSLENKEYIIRKLCKDDRRRFLISLTSSADKLIIDNHQKVNAAIINIAEHLGEEDTDKFIELLTKANTYLEKKQT